MERSPREVLTLLLSLLPYPDLKRCLLVSRRLHAAAADPLLWAAFTLVLSPTNLEHLADLLKLPRLQRMRAVRFQGCRLHSRHLALLLSSSKVTSVSFGEGHDLERDVELARVPPTTLAKFTASMEHVGFHSSLLHQLSELQTLALLDQMTRPTCRLQKMEVFYDNHLSYLPALSVARALSRLTHLTLVFQKLAPDKYNALFDLLGSGQSQLSSLSLPGTDLSRTEPKLLGRAVVSLTSAVLSDTKLSHLHLHAILSSLGDQAGQLRHLDLSHNGALRDCSTAVMAGLATLTTANLKFTRPTVSQLEVLLASLQTPASRLTSLSLVGCTSLRSLPPPLLTSLHTLDTCSLYATHLLPAQLPSLLTPPPASRLSCLDLGGNNLSSASPSLWPQLLSRLSRLSLYNCRLSQAQQASLLDSAASLPRSARLEHLDLGGNSTVAGHMVRKARDRVREVIVNTL